jgi:hypothetical protein
MDGTLGRDRNRGCFLRIPKEILFCAECHLEHYKMNKLIGFELVGSKNRSAWSQVDTAGVAADSGDTKLESYDFHKPSRL